MASPISTLVLSALCVAAVRAQSGGRSSYQERLAVRCKKAFSDDHDCRLGLVNKLKANAKTADCFKCPNNEVAVDVDLDDKEVCVKDQLQKCVGLPHDVRTRASPPVCDFTKLCCKARLSTGSGPNKSVFDLDDELDRRCASKVHPVCESWMRKVDCTCTNRALQGCQVNGMPVQNCGSVKV